MKRTLFFVALLAVAMVVQAKDGGRKFTLVLTGAEEFPGPGDPDGIGFAVLKFNPGTEQLCYNVQVENITLPATGNHIHLAPRGESGPVVIPLEEPDESGSASGCTSVERDLILAILQNPENYYINVHTLPDFGPGAVRAQLK